MHGLCTLYLRFQCVWVPFCVCVWKKQEKKDLCEFFLKLNRNFRFFVLCMKRCFSNCVSYLEKHQLDWQFLLLLLEKCAAIGEDMDGLRLQHHPHVKQPIAWTEAFCWLFEESIMLSVILLYARNDTTFVRCSHLTSLLELIVHLPPLELNEMNFRLWYLSIF